MREIRLSGSEGGGLNPISPPYPYPRLAIALSHPRHRGKGTCTGLVR
jgi:hypothetical protein